MTGPFDGSIWTPGRWDEDPARDWTEDRNIEHDRQLDEQHPMEEAA